MKYEDVDDRDGLVPDLPHGRSVFKPLDDLFDEDDGPDEEDALAHTEPAEEDDDVATA